jgi:hypothetical protein
MAYEIVSNSSRPNQNIARPSVTSYDSGYEHSVDHSVDVKLLVLDADKEATNAPASFALAS